MGRVKGHAEQAQHGASNSAKGQHEDAEQAQHGASDRNGGRAEGQQQQVQHGASDRVKRQQQKEQTTSGKAAAAGVRRVQTSSWPVEIITVVLFMLMSTTAGATEHGQAQQKTSSQRMQWVSKLGEMRVSRAKMLTD